MTYRPFPTKRILVTAATILTTVSKRMIESVSSCTQDYLSLKTTNPRAT